MKEKDGSHARRAMAYCMRDMMCSEIAIRITDGVFDYYFFFIFHIRCFVNKYTKLSSLTDVEIAQAIEQTFCTSIRERVYILVSHLMCLFQRGNVSAGVRKV